jgi:predicted MFS family arabinose efflux permease
MEPEPEHEVSAVSFASYVRLVRGNSNFRRLWLAQIVSEIGDWFYTLAIYSLLLQLTGRASSVALALVLQVLPQTFIGPTAGVVNDRVSRKQVMIVADLVRVVIVLSMLLVRSKAMVWLVYPLLLWETLAAAFFEPARSSVIPNITKREDVIVANTLGSATWSLNLVLGATLGGVAGALLGRDAVFVLNALSFLVSALLIAGMQFAEPHAEHAAPFRIAELFDYSPVLEGIRYVRGSRSLLATVFAKAGNLVIGPSWVLFTVMGQRYFPVRWHHLDAQRGAMLGMSLLLGARGLGALIGPLFSAPWAGHQDHRLRLGILYGYLVSALGYSLIGQAGSVWSACLWAATAHCGGATIWVFSTTLLQLNTEDRFRGRVFSADLGLCMLTIAAGAYVCGGLLDKGISARTLVTATGLTMLLPAALWAWASQGWKPRQAAVAAATDDAA